MPARESPLPSQGANSSRLNDGQNRNRNLQIRTARNILELDKKYQTIYGQSVMKCETARSLSVGVSREVDQKYKNIMRRMNCKFDALTHRAKNEVIYEKAKKKAAAEKEKKSIEDEEKRSQKVMRPMFAIPSTDDLGHTTP